MKTIKGKVLASLLLSSVVATGALAYGHGNSKGFSCDMGSKKMMMQKGGMKSKMPVLSIMKET